ncbi:ABC transporter ATP-binding protein/permease [Flavobacteriales bacterium]|nr:ABC transporter ATP-binding protein/permease [Flavobacteriales bacterium]
MKSLFRILAYAAKYKVYAGLNVLCNVLSSVFSLFSIAMVIPFLDLIFLQTDKDYAIHLEKGEPVFSMSADYLIDYFNYYLSINYLSVEDGKADALIFLCVIIGIMFFFKNLFRYLALYFIAPLRSGIMLELRNTMYAKMVVLPLSYFSEEKKGDILTKMGGDVQEIQWTVIQSLEMIFREPFNIILFLGAMVYMSPQLSLFVFVFLPVSGIIVGRIGRSLKRVSGDQQTKMGLMLSLVEESLSGLRIIKAFNAEERMNQRFIEVNNKYNDLLIKMFKRRDLASPLSEVMGVCIMIVVLWFGGQMVLERNLMESELSIMLEMGAADETIAALEMKVESGLKAATFIAFIILFSQIISPAKNITTAYYNIQKGAASEERIQQIIGAEQTIADIPNAKDIVEFNSAVTFNNVWFKYQDIDVLKDISFSLTKGKTLALVGASGSGKSTIADLVPRFYDAYKGEITIEGQNVKEVTLQSLRRQMGIVTQDPILFNDTILNNIAFGNPQATKAQIEQAAKVANAHEFISQLEQGYNTNIGDAGNKLSGGQKQRLSIARAILKNPPILILDEATSALDTESEKLVQDALNNLMKNRTSLVIAHRLSTIQSADEILVMDKGTIVERGSHNALIAQDGVYKKLTDLQTFE